MLHFSKNLFIVILNLILLHGKDIYASEVEELDGINVLKRIKIKVPYCALPDFLRVKNESKILINDLKRFCSPSESMKQHRILCHMLSYELEKACELPKNTRKRPSEALYAIQDSPDKICGLSNLEATNQWIWNQITNNGQRKIGVNAADLCDKVTKDTDTLRLARFFYKIAPRVRYADTKKKGKDEAPLNSNNNNLKESTLGTIKSNKDTTPETTQTVKEKSHQSIESMKKPIDNANDETEKDSQKSDGKINKSGQNEENKTSKATQTDGSATEKISKIEDGETQNTVQGKEELKDKNTQKIEDTNDKAAENLKEKKMQTVENTKDKTIEGSKETMTQAEEDLEDKAGESPKNKTTQTVEKSKDKMGEISKEKETQVVGNSQEKTGEISKDKTTQNQENAKDTTTEGSKEKTVQAVEKSKYQDGESIQEKTIQSGDKSQDKANESKKGNFEETEKMNEASNMTNKTRDLNDGGVEKSKQTLNSSTSTAGERTPLRKNATSELSETKDQKKQRVLDLNKGNNKEVDDKKDQASANDNDNDTNDDDDENLKDGDQGSQIPKPNISTKKDEDIEKKNKDAANEDGTKINNEAGPKTNNDPDDDDGEKDHDEESKNQLKQQQQDSDNEDLKSVVQGKGKPGVNNQVNGMKFRKPTDADKKGLEKNQDNFAKNSNYESSKTRNKIAPTRKYSDDDNGWSGSFVTYFLLFTLLVVAGYLVLHNKNKVLGLLIEGCRRDRSSLGRRHGGSSNSARYQRLSQSSS